jgi:DNA polymerase I-like protein with 3'-5' exonuclease and polymerase domains
MDVITLDFETYYSKAYSLSKLTTEEYIRSPLFQVIGVSAKVNDGPTRWFSGSAKATLDFLRSFDWSRSAVLSHNTMFDGAILSWRCGIRPARLLDTMCMSRALHGVNARHSLAAVAERYGVGEKGTEVARAIGKRRGDFSPEELAAYGAYCVKDTDLTWEIFNRMMAAGFPPQELRLIDLTLRMFTDPVLQLDVPHLEGHLLHTVQAKAQLLVDAGVADKADLMSNPKFAAMLEAQGVTPPMKMSARTGKPAYAFAKTDEDFLALREHESLAVQTLVEARLGNKTTIEETRTQRFIDVGRRGAFPVPLRYYAAHTGRWGGTDKINLQNLPSRGPNAKQIKKAIIAPDGHVLIDCDSSQIEARVLAWWAGQDDLVEAFAKREDVYKKMAVSIYGVPLTSVDKAQRHVGKTTVLGCGYGMGAPKFQTYLKTGFPPIEVDTDEAKRIIDVYRHTNDKIVDLWKRAQLALKHLVLGDSISLGRPGVVDVDPTRGGIVLPSGLPILYDNLRAQETEKGYEYVYDTREGPTRIYGGKCVENIVQALARCVVAEQMLKIAKRYRVVLTVHDSVISCVPEAEVVEAQAYIESCMRWTPAWATGLPVNCESGVGKSYGACE